jgi:anti-anti-sigma factor
VFSLESRVEGGCLILKASGEFTHQQCGRFYNKVRHEVVPGIRKVIVDAAGLTHMTASALGELAQIHCLLDETGCPLVLAGPSAQVRRMLLLAFLDKVIPIALTVEEALAAK